MPSDVGSSRQGAFKYLKDYLWSKVQGWIEKTLSSANKEVLVKSVAQAIPSYAMPVFKLPKGIYKTITDELDGFWWGDNEDKKKMH